MTIPTLAPAEELTGQLLDARQRELDLTADLSDEQLIGPAHRIVEPPLWELGHVAWFQEHWILRRLDRADSILPQANDLYDSYRIANAERWELSYPSRQETLAYLSGVLNRVVHRLEEQELTDEALYFYRLVLYHEDMHGETLAHIRQTLAYPRPRYSRRPPLPPLDVAPGYEPHDIAIPGGVYQLGATPDLPFVWDNEKWAHPVAIKPYQIAATPVTNADYAAFVAAGGYEERALWSEAGWTWLQESGQEQPAYWRRDGADGPWYSRQFQTWAPLAPFAPAIHVNWYEANAYCAWAGRRLPTEAEWELAASATPDAAGRGFSAEKRRYPWGDEPPTSRLANLDAAAIGPIDVRALPEGDSAFGCRQMLGNIWEWTADTFDAFPGFEIQPYATYSAPSFGQQKVLRGGCWATRSRLIRNSFRNFYTPDRNNIFAGFRTVAL